MTASQSLPDEGTPTPDATPALISGAGASVALLVVLFGSFMDLLDATIITVAAPAIARDLGAGDAQIQWMMAAYVLSLGAGLITGGRLGDQYGRKRLFMIGLAGFMLTSALCALAADPYMLIGMRAAQGLTAGVMVPQVFGIIRASFAPAERVEDRAPSEPEQVAVDEQPAQQRAGHRREALDRPVGAERPGREAAPLSSCLTAWSGRGGSPTPCARACHRPHSRFRRPGRRRWPGHGRGRRRSGAGR